MRWIIIILILSLLVPQVSASIIWRSADLKQVALTFDDGPSPDYTPKVLEILKHYKVKATFFVVGKKVYEYQRILEQIAADGHEIGIHTYYHSPITWLNDKKMLVEIKMTSKLISETIGRKVLLFRPPHGRMSREKLKEIQKAGYDIVLWSVNADDFYHTRGGMRTPNSIAKRVLSRIWGGDIILMHDTSRQIVEALPIIIKELKRRSYSFVVVSKLERPVHKSMVKYMPNAD